MAAKQNDLALMCVAKGMLIPATDTDMEKISTLKIGQVIRCKFTRMRNYEYFKKWWKMIEFAFEHWECENLQAPKWKDVKPERSLDSFRKDVTIMAGHYDAYYRIDGSVRIEAKSISFASMTEDEFDDFYSRCVNVILQRILTTYNREDLDSVVDQLLLGYA